MVRNDGKYHTEENKMQLRGLLGRIIAIDLGTVNSVVVCDGKVVAEEPTLVVRNKSTNKTLYGSEARKNIAFETKHMEISWPMVNGCISDTSAIDDFLAFLINKIGFGMRSYNNLINSILVIAVPCRLSEINRRSVTGAGKKLAHEVFMIEQPVGAAFSEGFQPQEGKSMKILDIGGGTTDWSVIAPNGVVKGGSNSICLAGNRMDQAIKTWVANTHNVHISDFRAQLLKHAIGCAQVPDVSAYVTLKVQDSGGMTKEITLTSKDMHDALQSTVGKIVEFTKNSLSEVAAANPEVTTKTVGTFGIQECQPPVEDDLIILTGGCSKLKGLDMLLQQKLSIPVKVAAEPFHGAALGSWQLAQDRELLKQFQVPESEWADLKEKIPETTVSPAKAPVADYQGAAVRS